MIGRTNAISKESTPVYYIPGEATSDTSFTTSSYTGTSYNLVETDKTVYDTDTWIKNKKYPIHMDNFIDSYSTTYNMSPTYSGNIDSTQIKNLLSKATMGLPDGSYKITYILKFQVPSSSEIQRVYSSESITITNGKVSSANGVNVRYGSKNTSYTFNTTLTICSIT